MSALEGLNPEQRAAAQHLEGPLLVLAGAGSGKTRVVTRRIVHLIDSGVDPSAILGLTFTNKAASEMRLRVRNATAADVLISTFHSLGARILRESIHHLGYDTNFSIYDEDDALKVIQGCGDDLGMAFDRSEVKQLKQQISKAKNSLIYPDKVVETSRGSQLGMIYRCYQERLKRYNAVDFDDLLFLPVELFYEHPEVLEYYQNRWRYVLVDEYQDTNQAQYDFVRKLVAKSHNLFVVGDPDQSIYSWRGAEISNILNFQEDYPNSKLVRLEQNYRSTSRILEAANALVQRNVDRYEKKLWSDLGEGEKISYYYSEDEKTETRFIADRIKQHQEEGVDASDIAIFYRTNFQSRAFEDRFLSEGIPYVIVGGISFYQRKEVKDVISYLRLIQSDDDVVAFERTVNTPKRGLGASSVEKLRQAAEERQQPILELCRDVVSDSISEPRLGPKQKKALKEFMEVISAVRGMRSYATITEIVRSIIHLTGYMNELKKDQETFQDRHDNVEELLSKASEWDEVPDASLNDFLEELSLKSNLDELNEDEPRVNLMTFHSGKGLEFTVVFMVGLEEDLFPHVNSRDDAKALEEERRLCYVGMTRAKRHLYLSHAKVRILWGSKRKMQPSRFLNEIPSEYLQVLRKSPSVQAHARSRSKGPQSTRLPKGFEKRMDAKRAIEFKEGDTVFHPTFGIGQIRSIYQGSAGLTFNVFFPKDHAERTILPAYTTLTRLTNDKP